MNPSKTNENNNNSVPELNQNDCSQPFDFSNVANPYLTSALFGHNRLLATSQWKHNERRLSGDFINASTANENLDDKRFRCDNCDKCFTDPSNLQRHIRQQHLGARAHPCPECGKTFATSSGLKQHQHIHSSVKPFTCEVCQKSYTQFSNLCRHKRMHSDCRTQIKCGSCGQNFPNASSLNKHRRFCENKALYQASTAFSMCNGVRFKSHDGTRLEDQSKTGAQTNDWEGSNSTSIDGRQPFNNMSLLRQHFLLGSRMFPQAEGRIQEFHQTPEIMSDSPRAKVQTVNVQIQCFNPSVDNTLQIPSYPSHQFPYFLTTNSNRFLSSSQKVSYQHRNCQSVGVQANDVPPNIAFPHSSHDLSSQRVIGRRLSREDVTYNKRRISNDKGDQSPLISIKNMAEKYTYNNNMDAKIDHIREKSPLIWNPLYSSNNNSNNEGAVQNNEPFRNLLQYPPAQIAFLQLMMRSHYMSSFWPYFGMFSQPLHASVSIPKSPVDTSNLRSSPKHSEDVTRSFDRHPSDGRKRSIERHLSNSKNLSNSNDSINHQDPSCEKRLRMESFSESPSTKKIALEAITSVDKLAGNGASIQHPIPLRPMGHHNNLHLQSQVLHPLRQHRFNPTDSCHNSATNMLRSISNRSDPYLTSMEQQNAYRMQQLAMNQLNFMRIQDFCSMQQQLHSPPLHASLARSNRDRYACKFCGKVFPRSANLTRHLRTHTGEQPYRCKYCDRSFSISSNLQRHVRNIHNKERPYTCSLCGRAFGQQTNLERHVKKHTEGADIKFNTILQKKEEYEVKPQNSYNNISTFIGHSSKQEQDSPRSFNQSSNNSSIEDDIFDNFEIYNTTKNQEDDEKLTEQTVDTYPWTKKLDLLQKS